MEKRNNAVHTEYASEEAFSRLRVDKRPPWVRMTTSSRVQMPERCPRFGHAYCHLDSDGECLHPQGLIACLIGAIREALLNIYVGIVDYEKASSLNGER
jgi:hypothetical protein